jgi:hypothetical protein
MATTMPQFRPLITGVDAEGLAFWERINYKWWLQRIPMFLFASVSSYGVGHFLHLSGLPAPFYQLGGISFDIGFLGAIALADMQLTKTTWNRVAYYMLNVGMSGLAALFNVLSHAGGKYADITPEAFTAGAPFAIIGLLFALYYESVMSGYIDKEEKLQKVADDKAAATSTPCDYCGEGKKNKAAVYGHYKSCAMKLQHEKTGAFGMPCKCLRCNPKV